jgi:bifunctional non-homologous end joining protein LigD
MKWREKPERVRPMLASTDQPPKAQAGLLYEPKYDGIRAIVWLDGPGKDVRLFSRNGIDKTNQFPAIAAALRTLAARMRKPLVLDGEIVAIDRKGTPLGFQQIQHRIGLSGETEIAHAERAHPTALILFDLLRDGDEDLRGTPLALRRVRLHERLGKRVTTKATARNLVRLSEMVADDGRKMLARAENEGWEGLIVKDAQSLYHSGRRAPAWRKLKLLRQQEFVIGGFTAPQGSRSHFGSLLVGYYDHDRLIFAGSVGTGFTQKELDKLAALLYKRAATHSPFATKVVSNEKPHWVRPDLVCEIKYIEMTDEGYLRQPVYLGLREDKDARRVVLEQPAAAKTNDTRQRTNDTGQTTSAPKGSRPWRARSPRRAAYTPANQEPSNQGTREPENPRTSEPANPRTRELLSTLEDMERRKRDGEVALPNGDTLRFTNLTKVLWPKIGATKGELLRYYVQVAEMILPAVDDRPLVMKRSPNGVEKPFFYQQRHPDPAPRGVRREMVTDDPADEDGGEERLIGGSLTTLLYMTQLAAISQDPWFSRASDPLHMDYAAIDLDPGDDATFRDVVDVALAVGEELDRLGIPNVPKTSGSAGMHIYIPLPKKTTYQTGQLLCHLVATLVTNKLPKKATIERMVKKRNPKHIYVDYLQNILGKTLATAYSARASDYAGVSTPLAWKEVTHKLDPHDFTIRTAPARFAKTGDLWKALRTAKPVNITRVLSKLK